MPHPPPVPRRARAAPPSPGALVARECARALGAAALLPAHALVHALHGARRRAELAALLGRPAPVVEPLPPPAPRRALRVFVSAAEPSGELHAARFVDELRALCERLGAPEPRFVGLGGPALAARGVALVGDPVARAAMGADVLRSLGFYLRLVRRAAALLRDEPPDLFVPVDSPALHAPLGRIARACGVPSLHYVTPQLWGWAPWRAAGYRRAVDLALTILPFEPAWFAARGVPVAHVGHPQRDALAELPPLAAPDEREPLLVLLPGSREGVVARNLPWMLSAAARVRLELPALAVRIAAGEGPARERARALVRAAGAAAWAPVEEGALHPLLARARVALSVSGTVLIDLLERRLPAVVVYRVGNPLAPRLATRLLSVPWFSSVNLLAGREVYPEFVFHGEGPLEEACRLLVACYKDPERRRAVAEGLEDAARALGPPGAARRAALHALHLVSDPPRS